MVLDAVRSEQAVINGGHDSGATAVLFAATHPARTSGLILINAAARFARAPDYSFGQDEETDALVTQFMQDNWGTEEFSRWAMPELARREKGAHKGSNLEPCQADGFGRPYHLSPRWHPLTEDGIRTRATLTLARWWDSSMESTSVPWAAPVHETSTHSVNMNL